MVSLFRPHSRNQLMCFMFLSVDLTLFSWGQRLPMTRNPRVGSDVCTGEAFWVRGQGWRAQHLATAALLWESQAGDRLRQGGSRDSGLTRCPC